MNQSHSVAEQADELLYKGGQNPEYPYLTKDRQYRITAHEVCIENIDAASTVPKGMAEDRLRIADRRSARVSDGSLAR